MPSDYNALQWNNNIVRSSNVLAEQDLELLSRERSKLDYAEVRQLRNDYGRANFCIAIQKQLSPYHNPIHALSC